jgi:hypothetical protein
VHKSYQEALVVNEEAADLLATGPFFPRQPFCHPILPIPSERILARWVCE